MMLGKFNDRLQCQVINITYDFLRCRGVAYFPENNCCDMAEVIALFTGIDPEVGFIKTFAGTIEDACYRRYTGGWRLESRMAKALERYLGRGW